MKQENHSNLIFSVGHMINTCIYCWNGDTLELEWKTNLEAEVYSTPFCGVVQATVENSAESKEYPTTIASPLPTVCVCSTIGLICLLNPQTGGMFARFRLPGDVFSCPVLLNNYIVVGCRNDIMFIAYVWSVFRCDIVA